MAIEALTADDSYDRQMGSDVLDMAVTDPASWLTDVGALWLDCPAREPCLALFSPPSLTQLSRAPQGNREGQEGQQFQRQLGKWLHSSGSTILTCVPSRCQRS